MRAMIMCVVFLTAACSSGGEEDAPAGNPAVFERIGGLTDCAELQEEFDTAEANGGETGTAYMKAADERMREVGCY